MRSRWVAPGRADLLLAVALGAVCEIGTVRSAAAQGDSGQLDLWAFLLVALAAAGLAWRRAATMAAVVGSVGAVAAYLVAGYPYGPVQVCAVVAMFEVGRLRPLRTSLAACLLSAVAMVIAPLPRLTEDAREPVLLAFLWSSWLVIPWALGALVQARAVATDRARSELVAGAALAERTKIAQEVHDAAGHGFSVIAMQAGVALVVLDEQPEQVRTSLEAIRTTSIQALDELRRTLGAFEEPGSPADLTSLVERVRVAGLRVDLDEGGTAALSPEAAAVLYRVVQESLTNVLRHARTDRARVKVTHDASGSVVEVTDQGIGGPEGPVEGRGLAGMRARVEAAGGRLTCGPRRGGGFEVRARLPAGGGAR